MQVWSRPDRVPFYGPLADALSRHLPQERAILYQPSALADADRLHTLLTAAGLEDVTVIAERRSLAFESFDDYWEGIESGGARLGQFYLGLPESGRRAVREEVHRSMERFTSGGRLVLEVEAFIARGTRR